MPKDLTVSLEDRPGALADLGEALGKADINIEGVSVVTSEGRGLVHVLVADASAARQALEGAGIKVEGETDVVVIDVSRMNFPGVLGDMTRKIANAGVNINFAYLSMGGLVVLATSDDDKARAALGLG
jgi:hypothetical protein